MAVTVRQVLETWPLTQAQLLAGADGLDNELSWVHFVEVFEDPYFLSPRVLLCTTGYGLRDDPHLQASVMDKAARVGIAAILMKTGYELKTVPDAMLSAADRSGIPFLKFPQHIPFSDVTRAVAGLVLRGEAEAFRTGRRILRRLMEAHASGGGFPATARVLGESLGCTVFVASREGEMLAAHLVPTTDETSPGDGSPSTPPAEHLAHYARRIRDASDLDRVFRLNRIVALPPATDRDVTTAFITPVRFEDRIRGFVGVVRDSTMTDVTHWSMEAAALVAAAEYRALRVEESTERRLAGDLLDALTGGAEETSASALRRLAAWGYDTAGRGRVVLVDIEPGPATAGGGPNLEEARGLLERYCGDEAHEPLFRVHGSGVTMLKQTAAGDLERERADLADLQARLAHRPQGGRVWAAAGASVPLASGLSASHADAARALAVLRRTRPEGGWLCAEDLGIDGLLYDVAGSERAADFAAAVLGPLVGSPPHRAAHRLLETLRTYLAADADTQETADRMFLHPNTVRYRLKTVEELTGLSLRSSADRTLLTVALRLLDLGGPATPAS